MSEMIERVARALFDLDEYHGYDAETKAHHWMLRRPTYEHRARLVIQTMRDNLTDSMAEVIAKHGRCCGGGAHTIWVEACDEALK